MSSKSSKKGLYFFLILFAFSALIPLNSAFGETSITDTQEYTEIPLTIFIQDHEAGELESLLKPGSPPVVLRDSLMEALAGRLNAEARDSLTRQFSAEELTLTEIEASGIRAEYDPQLLRLSVSIPPGMLKTDEVKLRERQESIKPEEIEAAPFSAYLNYYSHLDWFYQDLEDSKEHSLPLELSIFPTFQVYRWVFEAGIDARTDQAPYTDLEYARIIRDFPAAGLRLAAGTIESAGTGNIQPSGIDGVNIGTESALQNLSKEYKPFSREIFLEESAEVAIYLNGRLLKQSRFEAGTHKITDFPYLSGLNEVEIRIKEESGKERLLYSMVPFDAALLEQYDYQFSLSAGIPQHSLSDFLVSGYFSYGITPWITSSLSLQGSSDTYLLNLQGLFSTPLGNFGQDFSFSHMPGGHAGYSGQLRYRLSFPSHKEYPSLGVRAGYESSHFLNSALSENFSGSNYFIDATIGKTMPLSTYLNFSSEYRADLDTGTTKLQNSLTLLKGIGRDGSLSLSLGSIHSNLNGWDWHGSLSFSFTPRTEKGSTIFSQDLKTGETGASISYSESQGPKNGSYALGLQGYPSSDTGRTAVNANMRYEEDFARLQVENDFAKISYDTHDIYTNRLGIGAAGAVLFAGGHFGFTLPVHDSFLMVVPGQELQGTRLSVRRSRSGGGAAESEGDVLSFHEASSYLPTHLTMDLPFSSPDIVLSEDRITVIPYYHSGVLIPVDIHRSVYAEGYLMTLDDEAISLQAGELIPLENEGEKIADESESQIFFTDENGFFQLHDLKAGTYRLRLFASDVAAINISIPTGVESPYSIGTLKMPVIRE